MSQADNAPVFATTREDNAAMQKGLEQRGFVRVGKSWKSKRGEYQLILCVVPPPNNEMQRTKPAQATKLRR
jgi:hypothetical protein